MQHKILSGVVESCLQISQTRKLRLLGNKELGQFPKFKNIDFSNAGTFAQLFKEDNKIFYGLELHGLETMLLYEKGIGYIVTEEGVDYLVRESPLALGTNPTDIRPITSKKIPDFSIKKDQCLLVTCVYPSSYLEALSIPNGVLTSSDSPQVTVLPNFSFLGRLEGNIEAITFDELKEHKEFQKVIESIIMKTLGIPNGIPTQTPRIEI